MLQRKPSPHQITSRSLSVPVNTNQRATNTRKDSDSYKRVILPSNQEEEEEQSIPLESSASVFPLCDSERNSIGTEEGAVCRICLIELSGKTLNLECSCKGELCLAHQDCAVRWFSLKGNITCEVCNQQVKNLPVTLLKIRSCRSELDFFPQHNDDSNVYRQGHRFILSCHFWISFLLSLSIISASPKPGRCSSFQRSSLSA